MRSTPAIPLVPRRRLADLPFGAMRAAVRGAGHDLAGARPYRVGDDVRTIDHRASARLSSACDRDELVVREFLTEHSTRVVVAVDRRPAMALHPPESPWLPKPAAVTAAGTVIVESAQAARALIGYLDHANGNGSGRGADDRLAFWRPPDGRTAAEDVRAYCLPRGAHDAPEDALDRAVAHLLAHRDALPPASFLFLISDFLAPISDALWRRALSRGWDVVPVVVQDPLWEQSFPSVGGTTLPVHDPVTGACRLVRISHADAATWRATNEARLAALRGRFTRWGLDYVLLGNADPKRVRRAFERWAEARRYGTRLAR